MRVSQRLDQALRVLAYLAQHETGDPVPAGVVAETLGLPRRSVEQQLNRLGRRGLVVSVRGAGGGFRLAGEASDLTVADVVRAVEGAALDVPRVAGSAASELWEETRQVLERHLASVTLADMAARQDRADSLAEPMYYI
jgi:Rrf2 family protein